MLKWEYNVNGKKLRQLIKDEENFKILRELHDIIDKILKNKNIYYEDDFEELRTLLYEDSYLLKEDELLDYIYNESELYNTLTQYIDDKLAWFYELCDKDRIWITV